MKLWIILSVVFATTAANAQAVTSRVTGAVGGVTSGVGATAGAVTGGAPDFSVLNTTPSAGGDWNGGTRARVGGKDVTIRGAVASEGGASAFKAGAGIGF
jgi:hypothetical protein